MLSVVWYLKYGWKNLDVNRGVYYNFILCMIMIIVGITLLFGIGKLISQNSVLEFVGKNTLTYFIFHKFFFKLSFRILNIIRFAT